MTEEVEPTRLERLSARVHKGMEDFFEALARKVVTYPKITMAICIAITICCAQGFHVYDEELSSDKQFAPRDSRSVNEEDWVVEKFGHQVRSIIIYFVAGRGGNVLDYESLEFMLDYHEWIVNQHETIYSGKTITYNTECNVMPANGACQEPVSVLSLFGHDRSRLDPSTYQSKLNSVEWRRNVPSGSDLSYYMSRETFNNQTNNYESAVTVKAVYYLQNNKRKISDIGDDDGEARKWEIDLDEQTRAVWSANSKGIGIYVQAMGAQDKQEGDAISDDVKSLIIGYILTVMFASCVLSRGRSKYSHSMLGLASVLSIGMSTISAYGLCWLLGIKFNNVVQVLVLILLGIGVDDTFVIMESWWDTVITNMDERMIHAVRHAGPAITITSITDFIAFLAGSATVLPALRDFCYYAALGVFFDFAYQCTFFVAIAYFDSKRQESNRADCCCCISVGDESGCAPCLGYENAVRKCASGDQPWKESEEGLVSYLIGNRLPKLTVGTLVGKVAVALLSAFFLGMGIYGCTVLKMDFDNEWFVPDGAPMKDTFEVRDTYFTKNEIPTWLYTGEISYSEVSTQEAIQEAVRLVATGPVAVPNSAKSWLSDFITFVQTVSPNNVTTSLNGYSAVRPEYFYYYLLEFTGFSPSPYPDITAKYVSNQLNVLWNADRNQILGSKIQFLIKGDCTSDGESSVECMDDLRAALDPFRDANPHIFKGECFSWSSPFVFWEGFDLMIQEVTRNVSIAVVCVFVLVTILVANIAMGGIVVFMIGCVDICMLGFMVVVNVDVNSVSVVCIVVAIGLAVDYSVHIGHAFLLVKVEPSDDTPYTQRQLRASYALCKMGPAVFNGALSTFIAIFPLVTAKSYVFTVFFRMFVVIIFFGIYFGVVCLPVILSLVGPDPYTTARLLPPTDAKSPLTYDPYQPIVEAVPTYPDKESPPPRAKSML